MELNSRPSKTHGVLGLWLNKKNPLFFARRLEERQTECKVCGARVVWDRVELGHHVWTVHGLPLEAYKHL